jgi:ABC-type multidrug transport system ATPase subunit
LFLFVFASLLSITSTTGLDSSQAEKVINLIASLAKEQNVPSICTLHQPKTSIWKTLDRFILLAPGGKMCYAGETDKATAYFKNIGYECPQHDTNPAEYFIDLVTVDTVSTV